MLRAASMTPGGPTVMAVASGSLTAAVRYSVLSHTGQYIRAAAGGGGRTVTCKSEGFGYKHCSIGRGGHRIQIGRQLSDTRCNQGDNWGVDRGGIWVDRGC